MSCLWLQWPTNATESAGTSHADDFRYTLNGRMIVKMTAMVGIVDWKLNVELKQLWKFGVPHIHIVLTVTDTEIERQAEKPAVVWLTWSSTIPAQTTSPPLPTPQSHPFFTLIFFFYCGATAQCRPWPPHSFGFYSTYNYAPQLVGFLWTSDQLVTETSTWQLTTFKTNIHAPGGIQPHNLSRQAATTYTLDCMATRTGFLHIYFP